jgi:hypothetical protein
MGGEPWHPPGGLLQAGASLVGPKAPSRHSALPGQVNPQRPIAPDYAASRDRLVQGPYSRICDERHFLQVSLTMLKFVTVM